MAAMVIGNILLVIALCLLAVDCSAVCDASITGNVCNANPKRTPLVAGNWKMNTDLEGATLLATEVVELTKGLSIEDVEIALFPPFPFIYNVWKVRQDVCFFLFAVGMSIYT